MLDQLPSTSLIDKILDALYRRRGIDKWPEAVATVFSCEWHPPERSSYGYYAVTYTYRANGEIQEGSYNEDGSESDVPYQPGDTFPIQWNPRNPERSYTGASNAVDKVALFVFGAIAIIIILIGVILLR